MNSDLLNYALYFIIYSVIGWMAEVTYSYIQTGKFINCGLLYGPYVPIYGFGALVALIASQRLNGNFLMVFIISALISSTLEYAAHYMLERFLDIKFWDYSDKFFNLNSRICLEYSVLFGIGSLALVMMIHPWIRGQLVHVSSVTKLLLALSFFVYFVSDLALTLASLGKVSYIKKHHPEQVKSLRHRRQTMDEDFAEIAEKTKDKTHLVINTTAHVANLIIRNIKFTAKR